MQNELEEVREEGAKNGRENSQAQKHGDNGVEGTVWAGARRDGMMVTPLDDVKACAILPCEYKKRPALWQAVGAMVTRSCRVNAEKYPMSWTGCPVHVGDAVSYSQAGRGCCACYVPAFCL